MNIYELRKKIENHNAVIAILGLGYVGLPLAVAFSSAGYVVQGVDISEEKVELLRSGNSTVIDVSSAAIDSLIHKSLFVGNDFAVIEKVDVVIICVPTPLNEAREPDLSCIVYAIREILPRMCQSTLLILESTTYPGTTEELIVSVIEKEKGWTVGQDFFVCCSPERVDPGNKVFSIRNTPKVIGGATAACLMLGSLLYRSIVERVVPVSSPRIAETVKLLENTYRSVNIALINELAQMADCMGINIWEVIEAASTKPFGFMPFYPGPGIGGHCIPLDPVYLLWKAKSYNHYNRFIELASEINAKMPEYVVQQIGDILNDNGKSIKGTSILLLGLSYKKDVDDLRESPALRVFQLLCLKGARVACYDPHITCFSEGEDIACVSELCPEILEQYELVVITTDHSKVDYDMVAKHARLVFDTRNVTRSINRNHIYLLGGQRKSSIQVINEVQEVPAEDGLCASL